MASQVLRNEATASTTQLHAVVEGLSISWCMWMVSLESLYHLLPTIHSSCQHVNRAVGKLCVVTDLYLYSVLCRFGIVVLVGTSSTCPHVDPSMLVKATPFTPTRAAS